MTQNLYRKEALENRNRSLFGEIQLRSHPSTWVITVLLVLLTVLILSGLFIGKITVAGEDISLFDWLLRSFSLG